MYHLLLVISAVGAAVAVAAFLSNRAARDEINASLAIKGLTAPERATSYDAADLRAVAKYLKSQRSSDNRTLLDVYIRPVLMWNDIVFAVALSIFSGVLWVWLIVHFQLAGLLLVLVAAAAASAILYGAFDVAEDLTLARLFGKSETISESQARMACRLTRLKLATIIGSVTGGIVFKTLSWLTTTPPGR